MNKKHTAATEKSKGACEKRGRALTSLGMCADADDKTPVITMTGRSYIKIEHHRGIFLFTDTCVKLYSAAGLIRIEGRDMVSSLMNGDELLLDGVINSVTVE